MTNTCSSYLKMKDEYTIKHNAAVTFVGILSLILSSLHHSVINTYTCICVYVVLISVTQA